MPSIPVAQSAPPGSTLPFIRGPLNSPSRMFMILRETPAPWGAPTLTALLVILHSKRHMNSMCGRRMSGESGLILYALPGESALADA